MHGAQLVVLAAGMGSRYGGIKQLEGFGSSGATLLEYSVYDALHAGFDEVVFIIRHSLEADFVSSVLTRFRGQVPYRLVYQEVEATPSVFSCLSERTKPWGTAHALWCARSVIDRPFAVINADDFYGRDAFVALGKLLTHLSSTTPMCMVGYALGETLSDSGSVSRGVCRVNNTYLSDITEYTGIVAREDGSIVGHDANGVAETLSPETIVSMNCWGFSPHFLEFVSQEIESFFGELENPENALRKECYLPSVVRRALIDGSRCKVLSTDARWCGVTYPADKTIVAEYLNHLTEDGTYPLTLTYGYTQQ